MATEVSPKTKGKQPAANGAARQIQSHWHPPGAPRRR